MPANKTTKQDHIRLDRRRENFIRITHWLVGAVASGFVLSYVVLALLRMTYPFELEWMEGAIVDHVYQVVSGNLIYRPPSLDFVACNYNPLYYYICAPLVLMFGDGFFPLRLVSILASVGSFAIMFRWVHRETGAIVPALIAIGLFAACFRLSGAWYDIARTDSTFLLFQLWSLYALRFFKGTRGLVISSSLFALAYFSKQMAFFISIPIAVYVLWAFRWRAFIFLGILGALVGSWVLAMDFIHDGWYTFYTLLLPSKHQIIPGSFGQFWPKYILGPLLVAVTLVLIYLGSSLSKDQKKNGVFYLALFTAFVGSCWLVKTRTGTYDNTLIAAYAIIGLIAGLGYHRLICIIRHHATQTKYLLELAVIVAFCAQFYWLRYDVAAQVPTEADERAGYQFVDRLKQIDGEVLLPYHGYLLRMAGKESFAHKMAINDVENYGGEPFELVRKETVSALSERRFAAVVIDAAWFLDVLKANYTSKREELFDDLNSFFPVTGLRTRPRYLFVPRQSLRLTPPGHTPTNLNPSTQTQTNNPS